MDNSIIFNYSLFQEYFNNLSFLDKCIFFYLNPFLFEIDERIKIDVGRPILSLASLFYLSLAITINPKIINFIPFIAFIEKINDYIQKEQIIIRKIILAKLNTIIIGKIEQLDNNDELQNNLNEIKINNNNLIKNNIKEFKEFDLSFIINDKRNIDEIYIQILNELISSNKFDDYLSVENIMLDLDFEKIILTKKMEDKLSQLLNYDEFEIKQFIISKPEDLCKTNKINFYFILIKYILKDSIDLNKIPLLLNTQTYIMKRLEKYKSKILSHNMKSDVLYRMEYLFKKIFSYDYYNNNIMPTIEKLKKILNIKEENSEKFTYYYDNKTIINKNFIFSKRCIEKKSNIEKKMIIKFNINLYSIFLIYNLLYNSSFKFHINNKSSKFEIFNINNINFNSNEMNLELLKKINNDSKIINSHKNLFKNLNQLFNFLNEVEERIMNEYKIKNLNLTLFIFKESEKENEFYENLSCFYSENDEMKYKDENILINKTFSKAKGFIYLMKNIKINNNKKDKNSSNLNINNMSTNDMTRQNLNIKKQDRKIIKLKNKYIISYENNNLILFNNKNYEITNIFKFNYNILYLREFKSDSKYIKLISNDDKKIYLFEIDLENMVPESQLKASKYIEILCSFLLENDNYFIIINKSEATFFKKNDLFKKKNQYYRNLEEPCKGAILNNDNLIVLTQSKNPKEYKLILISIKRERDIGIKINIKSNNLNEFSFDDTTLCLINNSLICLSYKNKNNNYGILFIKIRCNSENNIFFYQTNTFNCICFYPLLLNQISNNFIDYLLVGGGDKGHGKLTILKITYDNNDKIIEISEKRSSEYKNYIISIINFKEGKEVLYACSDGTLDLDKNFILES